MSRTKRLKLNVETTPLRAVATTGVTDVLRQPREGLLRLQPAMFGLLAGAGTGLAFMVIGTAIVWLAGDWSGFVFIAIGALCFLLFVLMMVFGQRVEFDRGAGTWGVRRGGSTRYRALECITAVQLIEGGWHGGADHGKFFTYQVNLILDDADQSRLNLTNMSNWEATWAIGSQLAEFLGVELMDHVQHE